MSHGCLIGLRQRREPLGKGRLLLTDVKIGQRWNAVPFRDRILSTAADTFRGATLS